MQYLDFDVEISQGQGREYPVTVRSPAGEAHATLHFPFDELALESRLKDLRIALLRSSGQHRRVSSPEELAVQEFGQRLFEALFTGEVRSRYAVTRQEAGQRRQGVRLRLRILAPELAALPWEFLYDAQRDEYLSLSRQTPVVRYLDLPQPLQPLQVELPLRILGMIASPNDQVPLDIAREQGRMQAALQDLEQRGLIKLTWVVGQTWRDLQRFLQGGPWHVFHFIGHGGYNPTLEEGMVAFANEHGQTQLLRATELGRLLANHPSLRLVVLNACEGARGGERDLFSSTAATLARKGIPAVLAMQYEITDRAAIECTRAFYEALAGGLSVDEALAEARTAISLGVANTLEWGTPVLYLRAPDGRLFLPPPQTTARPGQSGVIPAPQPGGSGVAGGSIPPKAAGPALGGQSPSKPPPVGSPSTHVAASPDSSGAPGHQAGQRTESAPWLPGPSPVGVAPGAPMPGAPPRKGRVGLIALVIVLLVVAGGGLIVLGVNHQGPIAPLFPVGRSLTPHITETGTPPTLTATATMIPTPKPLAGIITEFPVPTGLPAEITSGPDGNLWFTQTFANQIGRISPSGTITEFSVLTPASFPFGITGGPDGNLWFTELVGKIGRITPEGSITEFPRPTPGGEPGDITVGPDGALWFTEWFSDKIGRITTNGQITEFHLLAAKDSPGYITAGPDGNFWFTACTRNADNSACSSGKIGRMTPGGQITEFPLPSPDSDPGDIAAGPDGSLWFIENHQHTIGRMTPSGGVTHFAIPIGSMPYEIISGPDGNLWFTAENSNQIGRVTPGGDFTMFPIPTSSGGAPNGITSGPDGNLWFTEAKPNQIGRITSGK